MATFSKTFFPIVIACGLFARASMATVQVNNLPDLSLDGVGVETVFSSSVWQGARNVKHLAEQVKKVSHLRLTPSERDVLRHLLMTDTSAEPALIGGDGSFGLVRAEALFDQGLFEDVITLIDQIPNEQKTLDMKRLKSASLFGAGRLTEACQESNMSFWEENENALRAVCVFYQGTQDEARLAFDVYHEGGENDKWISSATKRLFSGQGNRPDGNPPVWVAGLVATAFGIEGLNGWSQGILRAVALNSKVPVDVRLAAAEKTILYEKDRRSVWGAISTFDKADGQKSDIRERIKLYQNILALSGEKRFKAIRNLISEVKKAKVIEAWAPIISEMMAEKEVTLEQADLAADMIVVNAWDNNIAAAYQWYTILSEKDEVAALRLAHILNAMGGGVPKSIDPLIKACSAENMCDVVLRDIPFYFPVSTEVALSVPTIQFGYPGFVTGAIRQQILEGQIGLGILNSLILLGQSSATERPLVETIGKIIPQEMGMSILRERLLRGLSS